MISFLLSVEDNGNLVVHKVHWRIAPSSGAPAVFVELDTMFEPAVMGIDDRLDLHVDVSGVLPRSKAQGSVKRDVIITLLDDAVPAFASQVEADAWLAERQGGIVQRHG